jgi:hypothetical protein
MWMESLYGQRLEQKNTLIPWIIINIINNRKSGNEST